MEREEEKGCVSHPPIIPSERRHEGFFSAGQRDIQNKACVRGCICLFVATAKKGKKTLCDTVRYLFVSGHKHRDIIGNILITNTEG